MTEITQAEIDGVADILNDDSDPIGASSAYITAKRLKRVFMPEEFKLTPPDDFIEVQAQRRAEKISAAKIEVQIALRVLATDREGREAEMAADAIDNLIRVIIEEKHG